jgi:hypothetical protein
MDVRWVEGGGEGEAYANPQRYEVGEDFGELEILVCHVVPHVCVECSLGLTSCQVQVGCGGRSELHPTSAWVP